MNHILYNKVSILFLSLISVKYFTRSKIRHFIHREMAVTLQKKKDTDHIIKILICERGTNRNVTMHFHPPG